MFSRLFSKEKAVDKTEQEEIISHTIDPELRDKVGQIVDASFYLYRYHDILHSGMNPVEHFIIYGWVEGRDPNPYTILRFVRNQHQEKFDRIENLTDLLCSEIYHNPLMATPAKLEELRAAEAKGSEELQKYFLFDVSSFAALQHDVLASWPSHPINHLFYDGLMQNRLRTGFFIEPSFVPISNFINDYELCVAQSEPFYAVTFKGLRLPAVNSLDLSSVSVGIGIVLFRNSRMEIERLVRSIESNAKDQEFRVSLFVLDNTPEPLELSWLPEFCQNMNLYVTSRVENIGFALGHNEMMQSVFAQGHDYYLGLNPDGFMLPGSLRNLMCYSVGKGRSVLIEMDSEPLSHPKWYHPITGETEWVSGAAFLLDVDAYHKTKGFSPDFPMYCEDIDLSFRARCAGVRLFVSPVAKYYHDAASRLYQIEPWRTERMMIGTWFLCQKWGNPTRAKLVREEMIRQKFDVEKLPEQPSAVVNIPQEITKLMSLERFATSRFWNN